MVCYAMTRRTRARSLAHTRHAHKQHPAHYQAHSALSLSYTHSPAHSARRCERERDTKQQRETTRLTHGMTTKQQGRNLGRHEMVTTRPLGAVDSTSAS